MKLRPAVLALVPAIVGVLSAPPAPGQQAVAGGYREGDRSIVARNILPPGQGRYMNSVELIQAEAAQNGAPPPVGAMPAELSDQHDMYDRMVQGAPSIKGSELSTYFKDASFGVEPQDVARTYSPGGRGGLVVLRDEGFNVPHIYGQTRADVLFGAGYVSGEDRLFMMDVLRHLGRGRLSEFLGSSPANLQQDRSQRMSADYSEEEFQAMFDRLDEVHPTLGAQAQQDLRDFTAGANQYISEALTDPSKLPGEYPALQVVPEPWLPTDSVAVASLIGGQLGVGGGQELRNAIFLRALMDEGHTAEGAREIFDDFRMAEDPEAPTTTGRTFTWLSNLPKADADAAAIPDPGSAQSVLDQLEAATPPDAVDGPFGPIPLRFPSGASNALLITADQAKEGRPLAVFGPQVGYWSPEILMEIDMHGPGIDARGATFPGVSLYVLLGRGRDYAWSATSAGGDLVDVWAVELCEPDGSPPSEGSDHYRNGAGQCVAMEESSLTYVAKPGAGGIPPPPSQDNPVPILVDLSTHRVRLADGAVAIVQARGTVEGKPVAFASQRSSYGAEVDSALTYVEMLNPSVINGPADFQRAFGRFAFTFNWFYVDDRNVAYQLGGYHPLRAKGVDLDLPNWDRPEYSWKGMLSFAGTPKDANPDRGWITSWNNSQAPRFRAADNEWSYGPIHRSQLLDDRLKAYRGGDGKISLIEVVNAMGDAATVDLRGDKVLPYMLEVLGDPGDPALKDAVAKLSAWEKAGAHRRDRDGDGTYEHAEAVALMDAWWNRALDRVFRPEMGDAFELVPQGQDDRPGPVGSAYIGGWYGQLQKDLRTILGKSVKGTFSRRYCGGGVLDQCRAVLAEALEDAVAASNPSGVEGRDAIQYAALGVLGQPSLRWQNRPTFQQVMQFGDLCPGDEGRAGIHLVGSSKSQTIKGTGMDEVLCGLGGRDVLRGKGGADVLLGGSGNDALFGGRGRDLLIGGPGKDRCSGGPGKDRVRSC
ncbi:MAG TPA: penicillin acylase family protein [Actinomycetota bacterium]